MELGTHDYKRNGTTSLFAALDLKTSLAIGELRHHHRSVEFRGFLDLIEDHVPAGLDVHIIVTTMARIKPPSSGNGSPSVHGSMSIFTPTYGSWINLVERWFAELTNPRGTSA